MNNNELPERLLAQIAEYTGHGFVLFTTNSGGNIVVHSDFDSPIIKDGFMRNIEQFINKTEIFDMEQAWDFGEDDTDGEAEGDEV